LLGSRNEFARKLGRLFVKSPLNHLLLVNNLITVHPLGGCPMGGEAATGGVTARLRRGGR
jgi:hypothetical protein